MTTDTKKFSSLVHYIIYKCGSKDNFGRTLLYKLCYFSDFDHYELYERSISNITYYRIEHGPAPDFRKFNKTVEDLKNKNLVENNTGLYCNREQERYSSNIEPDLSVFTAQEIEIIDKVILKYSDKSARSISRISHEDTPWRIAKEDGPIDYEAVFCRSIKTSVRSHD